MVDDSGAAFFPGSEQRAARAVTYPQECVECATDPAAIVPFQAQRITDGHAVFLSTLRDPIQGLFASLIGIPTLEFPQALTAMAERASGSTPNARYFLVDAAVHVLLRNAAQWSQNGVALLDWLAAADADATLPDSVRP